MTPAASVSAQKTRGLRAKTQENPVETKFASVQGFSAAGGVLLKWSMSQEARNLGFFVYRIDSSGERMVSTDIILGAAARYSSKTVSSESYEFFDENGSSDAVYVVEAVGMDGQRLRSDGVTPLQVGDLEAISGKIKFGGRRKPDPSGDVNSSKLSLPKDLYSEVESNTVAVDPVRHRAVISRPGVKIGVRGEGLFRVTRAQLQAGGFNVEGDSALWQLYVNGVEQALSIGPNADYIEFFGKGIDTVESDIQTYYLVTGDTPGKRIQSRAIRLGGSTVVSPSYPETFIRKERTNYLNQVFNGEAENYFGRVITATQTTFQFPLSGIDTSKPNAVITLGFQGYSFDTHQVEIILNGNVLAPAVSSGRFPFSNTLTIPTNWLIEGTNSLQFRSAGPSGDISFFDFVQISFSRKFIAEQNRLKFFTSNYKTARIDGFSSSNVRVFDVTDENNPVLAIGMPVSQQGTSYSVTIPSGRGRVYYAVEDTAAGSVQSVTANDPQLLTQPGNVANLVIIAYKDFIPQANAWADYRRSQGISVKVVEVSEIFDEFNYGVLSSDSIRSFLSYTVGNWQTAPGYVLLLGDATYDSRNYQGAGYFNLVPTKFVSTIFTETGSDEALADFDGDGLAEMAVGRIPVRTAQDAADILARQISWEAWTTPPINRGTLFAFDLPGSYDFEGMSTRIRDQLPSGTAATMVGRASPTAQADLIAAMNTGKYLVNYSGHGSTGLWASSSFFSITNVPQLSMPPASRPIYTMLTCLNGFFVGVTNDSLSEVLLKSPNGGAVAAWASSGETTPDVQEIMALRFYNQIGSGPAWLNRIGDLIRDAKTQIPGGGDVRLSWALIGDPMLKVR